MDASTLSFKYQWLDDQGHATSFLAKKGSFDGETLRLDDTEIPVAVIVESVVRDKCMVISVLSGDEANPIAHLLFQPSSKAVTDVLKKRLDVARSAAWAQHHREHLTAQGQGQRFREQVCPNCRATIVLTDMPDSPQLYCQFCDSLTTIAPTDATIKNETAFRICDECGMYSKPRKFTIFYFYFLLVVYGFWSRSTWRCPPCMRGEAWKMFFGNLLFVLGVPVAIVQLFRCYFSDAIGGPFKGLDTGNVYARKGNVQRALALYRSILDRIPYSAGIKYNLGMALLQENNAARAAQTFELALADCANYSPAARQLQQLYTQLGETEKLKELERMWKGDESDEELDE